MSWTNWPLTANTNLRNRAIWIELIEAINEKRAVLGWAPYANAYLKVNDPFFTYPNIADIQGQIELLYPNFVNYLDNGGNWNNVAISAFAPVWTSNTFFNQINGQTYWTRKHGYLGQTTSYGQASLNDSCQNYKVGDVMAMVPIWNEMYRALNLLRWFKSWEGSFCTPIDNLPNPIELIYDSVYGNTFEEAYQNLSDGWIFGPDDWWVDYVWYTYMIQHTCHLDWYLNGHHAEGVNRRGYPWIGPLTHYTDYWCSIDFYLAAHFVAGFAYYEWDSDATGYNQDIMIFSESFAEATLVEGEYKFGSILYGDDLSLQDKPTIEPPWPLSSIRGYYLWSTNPVIKWDGPNGFSKIV